MLSNDFNNILSKEDNDELELIQSLSSDILDIQDAILLDTEEFNITSSDLDEMLFTIDDLENYSYVIEKYGINKPIAEACNITHKGTVDTEDLGIYAFKDKKASLALEGIGEKIGSAIDKVLEFVKKVMKAIIDFIKNLFNKGRRLQKALDKITTRLKEGNGKFHNDKIKETQTKCFTKEESLKMVESILYVNEKFRKDGDISGQLEGIYRTAIDVIEGESIINMRGTKQDLLERKLEVDFSIFHHRLMELMKKVTGKYLGYSVVTKDKMVKIRGGGSRKVDTHSIVKHKNPLKNTKGSIESKDYNHVDMVEQIISINQIMPIIKDTKDYLDSFNTLWAVIKKMYQGIQAQKKNTSLSNQSNGLNMLLTAIVYGRFVSDILKYLVVATFKLAIQGISFGKILIKNEYPDKPADLMLEAP